MSEKSVVQHVYTRAGRAVVCGIPGDDHNCDEMGCPSVEHVLFRAPHSTDEKPDKDAETHPRWQVAARRRSRGLE